MRKLGPEDLHYDARPPNTDPLLPYLRVDAISPRGIWVGAINVHPTTGEIGLIWVEPYWRRRGIGRALFEKAVALGAEHGLTVVHGATLTPAGACWARAVGGPGSADATPRPMYIDDAGILRRLLDTRSATRR